MLAEFGFGVLVVSLVVAIYSGTAAVNGALKTRLTKVMPPVLRSKTNTLELWGANVSAI